MLIPNGFNFILGFVQDEFKKSDIYPLRNNNKENRQS